MEGEMVNPIAVQGHTDAPQDNQQITVFEEGAPALRRNSMDRSRVLDAPLLSIAAEHGLELMAHSIAIEAEAAAAAATEASRSVNIDLDNGGNHERQRSRHGSDDYRFELRSPRKAVTTARHHNVRTLTLTKEEEQLLLEMPIKNLLRYIQGAVRTVHLNQQQLQQQQPANNRDYAPLAGLLNARDMRRLITGLDTESASKIKEMSIVVRRNTIILNLDEIRALILWDQLIVIIPQGGDSVCFQKLEENLKWLRVQKKAFEIEHNSEEEFELLALEAVLMTMVNSFRDKLQELRLTINKNAKALMGQNTLNTKHQDTFRHLKTHVANCQAKVRSLHKAIFDVLDDEDRPQMLHLTRMILNQSDADTFGHQASTDAEVEDEAEILLESYLGDANEIIMKWELIKENQQNTEDYVQMKLDMARNKLLTIGTLFGVINICFAFGAVITGIFGMNLLNGVSDWSGTPQSATGFKAVVTTIGLFFIAFGGGMLIYMYRARLLVI